MSPVGWRASDVVVDGTSIHVRVAGPDDGSTIVCAHGFGDDGACWSRFAARIVDRVQVVAVDARNHGRSGRGDAGWETLAADLAGVVDALRLDRPVLLGHSLGASTVALVAARRPDLVSALVLEDPPWRPTPAPPTPEQIDGARAWLASFDGRSLDEVRAAGRRHHPGWPDEEFDTWAPAKLLVDGRAVEHLAALDWREVVASVEAPVLVVLGDDELDAIATPAVAADVAALHPATSVVTIAGAGHNIRRERLDDFVEALTAFAARVAPEWPADYQA